ncbi:MAG: effector binding domain-containing protein [Theionarchaea archaeon]|nr:effector binding domain-containing protein [Theionarchaea archaeon]MBU6999218.1 effector binding domain-containing protein [Theionarchaea archaeon]MBU7019657.1 effector binding domain-containing protein [Theionarchaea archaeon]MBU7034578.1 effector binding domain-containing protein [Theionarchaea archaeon]MBU7040978.1 effector binding domain-containing protein [Theionarchaea archaeon]
MDVNSSAPSLGRMLTESCEDIVLMLGALSHEKRLCLVAALIEGQGTFEELRQTTGLGKTALAHHLGLLVESGLVLRTGRGRYDLSSDGRELLNVVGRTYSHSRRRKEVEAAKRADYIQKIHTKEVHTMEEYNVKIVTLEPMHVASVQVISETPEHDAWEKMRAWAEPRGLLEDLEEHPVYGFNNPNPSPGSKEYGYEFWIRVGSDVKPEGPVKIKQIEGGLYAVTTCNLKEELESEFFKEQGYLESWKKVTEWVKSSKYHYGSHQCLEKAHEPGASDDNLILDLYCPIEL